MSESFSIDECIKELEFVASIPPNHKPYYRSKTTIEKGAWFATFNRRWNQEKGEKGVIHIKEILSSCDLHYRTYMETDDYETLKMLSLGLKKSLIGFDNLIETYSDQLEVANDYKKCKELAIEIHQDIDDLLMGSLNTSENATSEENCLISVAVPEKSSFFNTEGVKFMLSQNKK